MPPEADNRRRGKEISSLSEYGTSRRHCQVCAIPADRLRLDLIDDRRLRDKNEHKQL